MPPAHERPLQEDPRYDPYSPLKRIGRSTRTFANGLDQLIGRLWLRPLDRTQTFFCNANMLDHGVPDNPPRAKKLTRGPGRTPCRRQNLRPSADHGQPVKSLLSSCSARLQHPLTQSQHSWPRPKFFGWTAATSPIWRHRNGAAAIDLLGATAADGDTLEARTPARVSSIDPAGSISAQNIRDGAAASTPSRRSS